MRPRAYQLLEKTKSRAFQQIQYCLQRERAEGNYGHPYKWYEDGETKECFAYSSQWYALRLMDWYGDADQPCFFNTDLGKWDTVYNMPVGNLVDCADRLLNERIYRKRNRDK